MVGLILFLNMRCEYRCLDLHKICWLDSYFLFLHFELFLLKKPILQGKGILNWNVETIAFQYIIIFVSFLRLFVNRYFFIFIILFLILVCKNTHSYCFWWENLWINFLWNQEKYFTIILNTSNTYSTDCESSFLFRIMNYVSCWSCNCLWISDMNSLIYVKFRWIIIE